MPKVYTVTQINQYIRDMLRRDIVARSLTIGGEVSNCTYHGSGHIYFTLKDGGATLSCVMFASDRAGLKFRMEEGQQVEVTGRVDVYPQGGRYQLYAQRIAFSGAGALYEAFLKCKEKLEEEGLFAAEYKRELPPYAKTLGVITAPTGAALRDIVNIATRRNPYVQIVLYPAIVQGDAAEESIVAGLRAFARLAESGSPLTPDVLIVGRGGGSIEDLWAFNSERVARAIFESAIPVVSAVGHETDVTIADFVADLRAPTPSAAAELAVFEYERFEEELAAYRAALSERMRDVLDGLRARMEAQKRSLRYLSPDVRVRDLKLKTDLCRDRLRAVMEAALMEKRRALAPAKDGLTRGMRDRTGAARHNLAIAAERLNGASPLTRLKAGYGYVAKENGARVTSAKDVKKDEQIQIYFTDGKIRAVALGTERSPFAGAGK